MLCAAVLCNVAGLAWLALAMDVHWRQVRGAQPRSRRAVATLRGLGIAMLVFSLFLCLLVDHPTMASLVWVMVLAAAALAVAFTLTWRPRALAPLVAWVPAAKPH
jgi:uncharacterized membrane protein